MNKNLRDKSLRDLGVKWNYDIPNLTDSSPIQLRSYKLYNKKIDAFTLEDIRFMIGQEIGVNYLVNIALDYLKDDIYIETEYYEGDLLNIILLLPPEFWEAHLIEKEKLIDLLQVNHDNISKLDLSIDVNRKIKQNINEFIKKHTS